MELYQYIAVFFGGVFFSNVIPHFIKGVSGDKFPTPFSNPRGKGLSSSTLNVVWALVNLLISYFLFLLSDINWSNKIAVLICFIGFSVMSIHLSKTFQDKHKE